MKNTDDTKRGRKPLAAAEAVDADFSAERALQVGRAAAELTVADQAVLQSSELYMAIGRIQMAHFVETVSSRVMAETYLQAKDAIGKIGSLPVKRADGTHDIVSSIEDFCEAVLGKTQRRCQQLAANLKLLGPELFETSERIGLRQRDYAAIKALPDDSQAAVKAALEAGDREAVTDLLQEFAVRADAARREADEARQTADARQRLLDDKNRENDTLKARLKRPFKPSAASAARTAQEKLMLDDLAEATVGINAGMSRVVEVMADMAGADVSATCRQAASNDLIWLGQRLALLMREHGIAFDLEAEVVPSWVKEQQAKLAAKGVIGKDGKDGKAAG